MILLVLNCGSSSIKYQVLDMRGNSDYSLMAKGLVERIGLASGILTHKVDGRDKYEVEIPIENHTVGIRKVLDILIDKKFGILGSLDEIQAVGHRVAHGGEFFNSSTLINKEVIRKNRETVRACSTSQSGKLAGNTCNRDASSGKEASSCL